MSFTDNNNLEAQSAGQADWDSGLNANFSIIDRGFHVQMSAGADISTGDILWCASGGIMLPYDATSLDLKDPAAISYKAVSSGESDNFIANGAINSVDVWSGNIVSGQPVYVSPVTPGFAVSSYSAAAYPAGFAKSGTGVVFAPGRNDYIEQVTQVNSLGELEVNSIHEFTVEPGHRGLFTAIKVETQSVDLWTLQFFSGSAAVSSERLFETASGGVTSIFLEDVAGLPFRNTDTASPGLVFGRFNHLSGSGVNSGHVNVTVVAERFR